MTTAATQTIPAVGKYVDTQHVDEVIRTYKKERWIHNTERIGKEDSLSGWYTIEEMEEFLANAKSHGANGVRMYFAAYPEDYCEVPEYAGRQTIVFVATKSKVGGSEITHKEVYTNSANGVSVLAYNASRLCPPNCGNGGIGSEDWGGLGVTILEQKGGGVVIV